MSQRSKTSKWNEISIRHLRVFDVHKQDGSHQLSSLNAPVHFRAGVLNLHTVMRSKAHWARIVVTIFTVAMFYASVCSASCAIGVCPDKAPQTSGHDCDQM